MRDARVGLARFTAVLVAGLCVCLAALAKPAVAASAAARAAGSPASLVPVWVLLDGDTPVSGGRVRIYAGGLHASGAIAPVRARPLRLRDGAIAEPTSASGGALLAVARLPRAFTVVVTGGRAGGDRLTGDLTAQVHGYRAGTVVHVNPVTTLVELWRRVDPGVSVRRATRTVYRALGIPAWVDDADLRATDRWFDGDAFLKASLRGTRARAEVSRETGDLLVSLTHGGRVRHFTARRARAAAEDDSGGTIAEWWKNLDIAKLVASGMGDLGVSVLKWGAQEAGKWLLGHLLDAWGLRAVKDFLLPKSDTQVIIEMMTQLNKRVADVQASVESTKQAVADSQFSILVGQTDRETAPIKELWEELAYVAQVPPNNPSRIEASRNLVIDIGRRLVDRDAAGTLNQALGKEVGNDILKAASQVYGAQRFFTHHSSLAIQAVYDYYALMQFRLATLLTEYWSTTPKRTDEKTCSASCVKRTVVDQISGNIQAQKAQVKPQLPSNKFVDTRTMKLWDARPLWVNGAGYKPPQICKDKLRQAGLTCQPVDPAWANPGKDLGSKDDFSQLIDGWQGKDANPLEYLRRHAGLTVSAPAGTSPESLGYMWLGPNPVKPIASCSSVCYQTITRVNLSVAEAPGPHEVIDNLHRFDPQAYYAHAMTRQPVNPGSFWWPSLGGK